MSNTIDNTQSSHVMAALQASGSSSDSKSTSEDIQNRFLTLLIAQLENQDPLNPMENTEMTSQLSQMSTVQGIEQLNTTLDALVTSLADTQAVQSSALIGKTVLVPGANLSLSDGEAYGGVYLSGPADIVTVKVYDASVNLVQTQSLEAAEAGSLLFSWDGSTSSGGTAADGAYSFKLAASKGSESVEVAALQLGTVSALTRETSGGFVLDLGALGQYDFADVQQVF
jgi:flagellar basal-body rod modification protein FlgD